MDGVVKNGFPTSSMLKLMSCQKEVFVFLLTVVPHDVVCFLKICST